MAKIIVPPKVNKVKFETTDDDQPKLDPADEMNRKLAEKQKAKWSGKQVDTEDFTRNETKWEKQKTENSANEKVIKGKVVTEGYDSFKTALLVLGPSAFLGFLRTPAGKRFLIPFLRICLIPIAFIVYYLFENNRSLSEADRVVYNEKSVMEMRQERLDKEKQQN